MVVARIRIRIRCRPELNARDQNEEVRLKSTLSVLRLTCPFFSVRCALAAFTLPSPPPCSHNDSRRRARVSGTVNMVSAMLVSGVSASAAAVGVCRAAARGRGNGSGVVAVRNSSGVGGRAQVRAAAVPRAHRGLRLSTTSGARKSAVVRPRLFPYALCRRPNYKMPAGDPNPSLLGARDG